jgi:hypothetical protein
MQRVKDPEENSVDNLKNVRREASRHFRNKNKEYLKSKMKMKLTVRTRISEACIGASMTLSWVTSLEMIY